MEIVTLDVLGRRRHQRKRRRGRSGASHVLRTRADVLLANCSPQRPDTAHDRIFPGSSPKVEGFPGFRTPAPTHTVVMSRPTRVRDPLERRERMRMSGRRLLSAVTVAFAVAAALASGAMSASQPTIEHLDIDRLRADPGLTAACGVEVTAHVQGHVVIRTFPGKGTGPAELVTLNITVTAMAGANSYTFRVVGANLVRVDPEGTVTLTATGQQPFEWTGALKINLTTGELILEPRHSPAGQLQEACEALTA
jgi:hypothetical protein